MNLQEAIDSLWSLDPEATDVHAIRLVIVELERLQAEIERLRAKLERTRKMLDSLMQWPDGLPLLSEEDLAKLKAFEAQEVDEAAGGEK